MDARVSILVPIYAPGPVIERCFESIRNQNYPEVEVIPIDDAGPEPVRGILGQYSVIDQRWKPIYHEANQGLAASLNDAFRKSTGDYILVLEQDCELVNPDAIERALAIARAHPQWCLSGLLRLPYWEMRPMEIAFASIRTPLSPRPLTDPEPEAFMELKCDLIPRAALLAAKGFDERLRISGEDQILSMRLRRLGWKIVGTATLETVVRSGRQTDFRSNIRKTFLYGFTQAQVLLTGARQVVALNLGIAQGRERMMNRFLSVASGLSLFLLAILSVFTYAGITPLVSLLPTAVIPTVRLTTVMSRTARLRNRVAHGGRLALLTVLICPIDDLVYTSALTLGMMMSFGGRRRNRKHSSDGEPA